MKHKLIVAGVAAAVVAGCATTASTDRATMADAAYEKAAIAWMKRDFKASGIAKIERLNQDELQQSCTQYHDHPPADVAHRIQAAQLATVKYPADGKLMGNWKSGERIAQNGRGFTWRDKASATNGGSCYNCHQIGPKTTSYGNIGTSLYRLGKLRGNGIEMQRYVYAKIYNSKAYSACSAMPRFGHVGALTESQIKDLVALLLDPESPVNK